MDQQRFLEISYQLRKLTLVSASLIVGLSTTGDLVTDIAKVTASMGYWDSSVLGLQLWALQINPSQDKKHTLSLNLDTDPFGVLRDKPKQWEQWTGQTNKKLP